MIVPNAWCPVCRRSAPDWSDGPGGRKDASCGTCNSLERHRLVALVLDLLRPHLARGLVVEAAPTPAIQGLLLQLVGRDRYLSFDLGLDDRDIHIRADVTQLPFPDRSIETLVCFHVLEHVPDDAAAMRELARVIADDGLALVMNPWARGRETDEDPAAPEQERVRRFGRPDHVRLYGRDFEDRLRAAGLHVHRFEPTTRVPAELAVRANLGGEPLWILTREGSAGDPIRATLDGLLPPEAALPVSVLASRVSPLMLAGDTPEALAALVAALDGFERVALLADTGALEHVHRLAVAVRDDMGARRDMATRLLVAVDAELRTSGCVESDRWAEALPGLTSNAGASMVKDLFSVLPDAQLVHATSDGQPLTPGARALQAVGLRAGFRRYFPIDPIKDKARLHDHLAACMGAR